MWHWHISIRNSNYFNHNKSEQKKHTHTKRKNKSESEKQKLYPFYFGTRAPRFCTFNSIPMCCGLCSTWTRVLDGNFVFTSNGVESPLITFCNRMLEGNSTSCQYDNEFLLVQLFQNYISIGDDASFIRSFVLFVGSFVRSFVRLLVRSTFLFLLWIKEHSTEETKRTGQTNHSESRIENTNESNRRKKKSLMCLCTAKEIRNSLLICDWWEFNRIIIGVSFLDGNNQEAYWLFQNRTIQYIDGNCGVFKFELQSILVVVLEIYCC